jgi:hypothetical protein
VSATNLSHPEADTIEFYDMGRDLFPDAPKWGERTSYPEDPNLPSVHTDVSGTTFGSRAAEDSDAP